MSNSLIPCAHIAAEKIFRWKRRYVVAYTRNSQREKSRPAQRRLLQVDRRQHNEEKNLPFANPVALIPLKARAWLDLSTRAQRGEKVDGKDIAKHRTDVFRIAATLPGGTGPKVPESIKSDLNSFLAASPVDHKDWPAVLAGLKTTIPGEIKPDVLIDAVRAYFALR
jgi:hypothetical protein